MEGRPSKEKMSSDKSKECIWGEEVIKRYIDVADQESHDNPRMHLGLVLGLLGESLRNCTFKNGSESCRVHPLVFQKSGSGKESAFGVAENIANLVDDQLNKDTTFDFHSVDNITSGNLAGTQVNGKNKRGVAEQHDILALREAKDLFTHHEVRSRMRILMDGEEVTREMREGTITTESTCTIMGTVPPREISADKVSKLVSEGTLARPLYFYSEIDLHDTTEIIGQILTETSTDGQRENSISSEKQKELTQRICRTLVQITEHYADGVDFEIALSQETLESAIREQIEEELERQPEEVKMIVQPMLTRYTIHALRIACIMAALDECSHTVGEEHLDQAMTYWRQSFYGMLDYFNRRQDEISGVNKQAMRRERDKARSKLDLLVEILRTPRIRQTRAADELRVSPETIRGYAKELEEQGAIEVQKTGNSARYIPVDNSRNSDVTDFM
jgi:predicted transcriptional regulator